MELYHAWKNKVITTIEPPKSELLEGCSLITSHALSIPKIVPKGINIATSYAGINLGAIVIKLKAIASNMPPARTYISESNGK